MPKQAIVPIIMKSISNLSANLYYKINERMFFFIFIIRKEQFTISNGFNCRVDGGAGF